MENSTLQIIWDTVVNFFSSPTFTVAGGITFLLSVLFFVYLWFCSVLGITPIAFRLGVALWRRRVAIVGNYAACTNLQGTLVDSGIFKKKRIHFIDPDKIEKVKGETILLVDWESAKSVIDQIFTARKSINTAVVVFAKHGAIPLQAYTEISDRPNTVVVNSRGRLLNDLLTSLMTTSYDRA